MFHDLFFMYARALLGPIRWGVCLACSVLPHSEVFFVFFSFFFQLSLFCLFLLYLLVAFLLLFVITFWLFYGVVDSRYGNRCGFFVSLCWFPGMFVLFSCFWARLVLRSQFSQCVFLSVLLSFGGGCFAKPTQFSLIRPGVPISSFGIYK